MKVTLNWLKQYVDFNWSPEELAERLTMLGLEVEGVQKLAGEFDGVVVAEVITRDKHPNADKLSVCRVNDGRGERQIVCGAQNFKPGDKVPLILPGASLPLKPGETQPFTIKVGKIRNVESHGMMCSHTELGLDPDTIGHKKEDGLLILRGDAKVGQPFAEYLGRSGGDVVYDLETTPNRPDWNSLIGIAREIAALTGNALKLPSLQLSVPSVEGVQPNTGQPKFEASTLVTARINASDLCPRYTARIMRGVKIGPSPAWLRSTLEKVGVRSINNVVDVTNYVMLESGQPLHAFDYHLIAKGADGKPAIVVRRAQPGELFVTLDGQKHTLSEDNLLIADEQKGIALAGVMGGQNTEINDTTVDVLLESACFAPSNIRRTSKMHGLRTDSSYRFERGCDPNWGVDFASRRAAQLILQTAGGTLAEGAVDAYPQPAARKHIALRHTKTNDVLGVVIAAERQVQLLQSLGLQVAHTPGTTPTAGVPTPTVTTFEVPTSRPDLKREVDLIEEIARLYGVDKIPATPPRGAHGANAFDATYDTIAGVRRLLAGLGLNEAQGQTLIGRAEIRGVKDDTIVALANPLSSDMDVLRPSLLPGLIHSLRHNVSRKTYDAALFEIGRVFIEVDGHMTEERRVAIALTGTRALPFWSGEERHAKYDAMDLKGIAEELLEHFGLRGIQFARRSENTPLLLESAALTLGGKVPLGELGQLLPTLARNYDLRDAVFLAEFRLDELMARSNPTTSFKPLPQLPASRRDVAMLVPETTTHEEVLRTIKQAKPANLESVELFDVFRGKNVPEGQKSLAYAFTYRGTDKTLTDTEINAAHARVLEALKSQLKASLRE
jgi:phenylalanyl-tRNA synthetase beta chain